MGDFCPVCGFALTFVKELEEEPAERYSERLPGEIPPPPVEEPAPEPVAIPIVEEPTPVPAYEPPPAEIIVVPPPALAPRRAGLPVAAIVAICVIVLALIGGGIWAILGRQPAGPTHTAAGPTQSTQPSETTTPAEPEPVVTLQEIDPASIQASASSALPADEDKTYSASNTLDGNAATAWNEAAPGNGESEWISYALTSPVTLGRIDITNGYTKSDDVFAWNARVREIIVITDQGEFTFTLADTQAPQPLTADFGETATVTLKIVSVYPGTKYEDCAITDVQLWSLQ